MAQRIHAVDLNLVKNTILNFKMYPLSTVNRNALSATLNNTDEGLSVWDTDLDELFVWSGTVWVRAVSTILGAMTFRGGIAATANAPSNPVNGDTYVFTSGGTLNGTWAPTDTVMTGDQAVYDTAASVWRYIQGNAVATSTSIEGLIELATQAEVNAGSDAIRAVTPNTLAGLVPNNALTLRLARRFVLNITSLVANVASTVTHNLELANANDLEVQCWQGNAQINLAIDTTTVNALTVTSNVTLSNVRVVCIG